MLFYQFFNTFKVIIISSTQFYETCIYIAFIAIEDVRIATGHTCSEVTANFTKYEHFATSHVFTAMVADAFHNGSDTAVTNGKTFTGHTVDVGCTRGCTIKCNVTDKDIFISFKDGFLRWIYSDGTTRQAFTEVIIRITFKFQCHAFRDESTEGLTSRAFEIQLDRIVWQTAFTITTSHLRTNQGTYNTVDVSDSQFSANRFLILNSRTAHTQEFGHIQGAFQLVILVNHVHMAYRGIDVWTEQYTFKIDARQFEVIILRFLTHKIDTTNELSYGANT